MSQAFDKPGQASAGTAEPAEPAESAKPKAEPVAEAEPAAEPAAEAVAKPEDKAIAEVEAEATAIAEPEAAPEPAEKPETKAAAEAEAKAEAAEQAPAEPVAEAEAKAEPTAEPVTEPVAEPVAETVTEPIAEPVAETVTEPKPKAEDQAKAAASLSTTAPALLSLYKSAAATLDKHGLATQRAAVYLVLDRSGSMRNYYKDGTVQNLAEQALGLAAHFDDDATVPVVFFSTDIDGTAEIDLTNYEGRIAELHAGLGHMGRTNYHWAINAVIEHYKKSGSTAPAFVIFQTDGAPTSKPAAEKALCEAAGLPLFWQFIGFGDPDAKGFDFLRKLDDLAVPEKRVVDNAGFFHAGRDPRSLSHDELYQQLMVEFPEWLAEARTAGVIKDN